MAAPKTYEGLAPRVRQVSTVTVGGTISGETFTISAAHPSGGGTAVQIASYVDTDTVAATVATNLETQWNASVHKYARDVTVSRNGAILTFTARRAGDPYIITVNTPGGSATFVLATTTANSGPNVYGLAGNWRGGIVPVAGDDVLLTGAADILYGLDQSGVAIDSFTRRNHTGRVGWPGFPLKLDPDKFIHDNMMGQPAYIDIGSADINPSIIHAGLAYPVGLYLTGGHANAECTIWAGNVDLAWIEGDVYTAGTVISHGANVRIGPAAVVTNYRQSNGDGQDRQTANRTLVHLDDGTYWEELAGTLSTLTNNGAIAKMFGLGAISAGNLIDGFSDFVSAQQARSVTLNFVYNKASFNGLITGTQTALGRASKGSGSIDGNS